MNAPMGGFGDLAEALLGGGQHQDAFMKGATQRVSLEQALANAKIKRDQAMARDNLDPAIAGASGGLPPEAVALMQVLSHAAGDPSAGYLHGQQGLRQQLGNEAIVDARALPLPGAEGYTAATPDILNQVLFSGLGKALTPSNVEVLPQAAARRDVNVERAGEIRTKSEATAQKAADSSRLAGERVETEKTRRANIGKTRPKDGPATPPANGVEKTIGGKTYVKRNGKWFEK